MKPIAYPKFADAGLKLLRAELAAAAALAVAALGVVSFIVIADEISEDAREFDIAVLQALRVGGDPRTPVGPHWLAEAAAQLTSFGDTWVLVVVTLIAVGFLLMQRKAGQALLLTASVVGGTLLSEGLKDVFARERPAAAFRLAEVHSESFPSGHAMMSAVAYLTLGALIARVLTRRRLRLYVLAVAFALAGMVGLTRIYLGVHWTTDVIAGWALGSAWAMACWLVAYAIHKLRTWRSSSPAAHAGERSEAGS